MTRQEIIDAFDVAQRLQQLVDLVASKEARSEMISAAETIIGSVTDDDEALDIILLALKAETDPTQLRELIEENGRLKRELDAARNEKNAITITANKRIEEVSHLRRELEEANEREAKMMVRIAELTAEPIAF